MTELNVFEYEKPPLKIRIAMRFKLKKANSNEIYFKYVLSFFLLRLIQS